MRHPNGLKPSTLLDRALDAGHADSPALITADGTVTCGLLARLTAGVADYLRELGVQPEQRVLMVMDDSPAFVATFLGATHPAPRGVRSSNGFRPLRPFE